MDTYHLRSSSAIIFPKSKKHEESRWYINLWLVIVLCSLSRERERKRERENNNRSHMKEAVILKHTKMFIKILSVDKKYLTTSIFWSNNIFICIHQNLKSSGLIRRHVIPSLSDFKTKKQRYLPLSHIKDPDSGKHILIALLIDTKGWKCWT